MTDFDNTNTGVLFNAISKKTKPTFPDYSGSINVDGVDYWLNAWLKTSQKTGDKFMSLTVKPKEAAKPPPKPASDKRFGVSQARQLPPQDDDSDIPF
jgi:hypothetical protein